MLVENVYKIFSSKNRILRGVKKMRKLQVNILSGKNIIAYRLYNLLLLFVVVSSFVVFLLSPSSFLWLSYLPSSFLLCGLLRCCWCRCPILILFRYFNIFLAFPFSKFPQTKFSSLKVFLRGWPIYPKEQIVFWGSHVVNMCLSWQYAV